MFFARGGARVSRVFILSSFFGALLIASAFAYFNYTFQKYKIVDFDTLVLYSEDELFSPEEERYTVLFYSSKISGFQERIRSVSSDYTILAIDLYQERPPNEENIIYLSAGTNTLLKFIQQMNIYKIPVLFDIKRYQASRYKQDSRLQPLQ